VCDESRHVVPIFGSKITLVLEVVINKYRVRNRVLAALRCGLKINYLHNSRFKECPSPFSIITSFGYKWEALDIAKICPIGG